MDIPVSASDDYHPAIAAGADDSVGVGDDDGDAVTVVGDAVNASRRCSNFLGPPPVGRISQKFD